jgi:hypothetical protein
MVRVMFAVAAALSTALSIGSVLTLASHYDEAAQLASARAAVVAQR